MPKRWLIFWIVFACGLCWMPSGWLTGLEAELVPATKGQTKAALLWREMKEPLAHGLLMMGVAYSLMRLLTARILSARPVTAGADPSSGECSAAQSSTATATATDRPFPQVSEMKRPSILKTWILNPWVRSACITVIIVMVIAVMIECAQSLLPSSFSRGYAWGDLEASLLGGIIGTLAALRAGHCAALRLNVE